MTAVPPPPGRAVEVVAGGDQVGGQFDGPERADVALMRRGLARSRTHAAKLVAAGRVHSGTTLVDRPSRPVERDAPLDVASVADDSQPGEVDWVSRGGVKLDRALAALAVSAAPGVPITGRRCLDAGASTGGFTEVLLRHGAAHVLAVDVGHDQLAPSLRADPRVDDREGVSVRDLTAAELGGPVDLLVADLSFISLRTVLPDLLGLVAHDGDVVVMVKPQFEVGRAKLPRGGVVRDVVDRVGAVLGVAAVAGDLGWSVHAATPSELPGPAGNLEFFLWLSAGAAAITDARLTTIVRGAG